MKITFNSENNESCTGILYYDIGGNLILNLNNAYYFIDIDKNNELEFVEITNLDNLKPANENTKYKPIKNTYEKFSLREKAMDEIDKNENTSEHFFDDEYEHNDEYKEKYKYYPEDKYYYVFDDGENDDASNNSEDECVYSKYKQDDKNDDIIPCFNKTLGTFSLYDTLVFDKTNKLILKTIESKNSNSYRITISTPGEFELNVIGDKRICFAPTYTKKDNLAIPILQKLYVVSV